MHQHYLEGVYSSLHFKVVMKWNSRLIERIFAFSGNFRRQMQINCTRQPIRSQHGSNHYKFREYLEENSKSETLILDCTFVWMWNIVDFLSVISIELDVLCLYGFALDTKWCSFWFITCDFAHVKLSAHGNYYVRIIAVSASAIIQSSAFSQFQNSKAFRVVQCWQEDVVEIYSIKSTRFRSIHRENLIAI